MSVKEVKEYYMRMTSDYVALKETLQKLESEINEDTTQVVLDNIQQIKKQYTLVEENYNRLSYVMYLLNMPKRNKKKKKWAIQNKNSLNKIPEKDRLEAVHQENKDVISNLKQYISC